MPLVWQTEPVLTEEQLRRLCPPKTDAEMAALREAERLRYKWFDANAEIGQREMTHLARALEAMSQEIERLKAKLEKYDE